MRSMPLTVLPQPTITCSVVAINVTEPFASRAYVQRRPLSIDDLICPQQQRLRERQPERPGGFHVDDQLELRRLLHGEVGRLGALEDFVDIDCRAAELVCQAWTVGHEKTLLGKGDPSAH